MNKDDSRSSGDPPRPGLFTVESYSEVLDKVFRDVLAENAQLDIQRSSAPDRLAELERLPPTQRQLLIHNSAQYKVWPLIEEALGRCRECWSDDPNRAEDLANLALQISKALTPPGYRETLLNDVRAEVWSHIGNCRRIRSDLRSAHEAFAAAERFLLRGTGDSLERARFLDLRSSLLRAQRDFKSATTCLAEAIGIYGRLPDRHAEGRALLKQAVLLASGGEPSRAIGLLERAEALVDFDKEPRLKLLVKWNLAVNLRDVGRLREAQRLLVEARELCREHGTGQDRLRLLWAEGVLRSKLGQFHLAEEALRQVREGFIAAAIGYDVALVSLDLASLYLENGRTDEVRRLAIETMPIFASRNVQRELLIAWNLFRDAAESHMATLRLINDVVRRIRSSSGAVAGADVSR